MKPLDTAEVVTEVVAAQENVNLEEQQGIETTHKVELHVEAIVHPCCTLSLEELKKEIHNFITTMKHNNHDNYKDEHDDGEQPYYYQEGTLDLRTLTHVPNIIKVSCIQISIHTSHRSTASSHQHHSSIAIPSNTLSTVHIHPYTLTDIPSEPEEIQGESNDDEPIVVCETLSLPHESLHTSWENLILPRELKNNLLSYAQSAILFSNRQVNPHIIGWNRVLLLYGPPGTGKTSLCKALAHKLSIRCMDVFSSGGYLLEIKSHSLFSKWFSESGKLISRLFGRVREMVEDEPDALFFILMDEVESLANSRVSKGGDGSGNGGGYEPSDSIRAVNSLLTSLDSIRHYRNVMILSTSNITDCVDGAFLDRVDWMVKVDLPCLEARYEILRGCIGELMRVGILENHGHGHGHGKHNIKHEKDIGKEVLLSFHQIANNGQDDTCSGMLLDCARMAEGLSGRSLRKIPFQSHAFHIHSIEGVSLQEFLKALKIGIERKVKGYV
mmetsp:Transcript_2352/g.4380  ORF Transcript_2352/g.4380 Transcript_2352/m.4380 type:complete len:498 (+) Transcript_2352:283-1776(+)